MNQIKTNIKVLQKVFKKPKSIIGHLDLIYTTKNQLSICRKKSKGGFFYTKNGKRVLSKKVLNRIKKLSIPPAWSEVKIATQENAHLQAVGRDVKKRKQYRYHPLWNSIRNQTKFYKMEAFGKLLPKIRKQVDRDLEQPGWPRTKVLALIIRLMEDTHIRIGNKQYAKRNKTYGLSTMRNRHVSLENDGMIFEFVGKRGKKHSVTLKNKKLIRLVLQCEEIPGWELFQYYDENGIKHSIESDMINDYIHQICGDLFTAKDFRTWAATSIFFETLMDLGLSDSKQKTQQNILKAYDEAANGLGNTRNVCRKYYVHPAVVKSYENGSIQQIFDRVMKDSTSKEFFSPSEEGIIKILENYEPIFLNKVG